MKTATVPQLKSIGRDGMQPEKFASTCRLMVWSDMGLAFYFGPVVPELMINDTSVFGIIEK